MAHAEEHAHKRQFSLKVAERGRVVLPSGLRSELGIEPGDRLIATVEDDGSLRLTSWRNVVEDSLGMLREWIPYDPDHLLSDEVISDRRREAAAD